MVNKQEAMKRLEAMQKEVEKLKAIIEKPDEVEVFQGRYLREGLGQEHWCLDVVGDYHHYKQPSDETSKLGICFATEEAIKQHREHLRLVQEVRVAMAKSWGDVKVDWANEYQYKYVIDMYGSKITTEIYLFRYHPIHFRTAEDREQFFNRYSEDELKLMIMGVQ